MRSKTSEVSVGDASHFLGVSTRSVLNYIKSKEIEALKVGKSWFINKASLEAFSMRYGMRREAISESKEGFSENSESVGENKLLFPKDSEGNRNFRKGDSGFPKDSETSAKKFSVKNLRLFIRVKEILGQIPFEKLELQREVEKRLVELRYSAVEFLGAGYYSFLPAKKMELYNLSRQRVGALVALLQYGPPSEAIQKIIYDIEEELMPTYSALIKRMDKKCEKSKNL